MLAPGARPAGGAWLLERKVDREEWIGLRHSSRLLKGQRAVIFGYGAIAARLATMLAPFHMEVSAVRRRARGDETVRIAAVAACRDLNSAKRITWSISCPKMQRAPASFRPGVSAR